MPRKQIKPQSKPLFSEPQESRIFTEKRDVLSHSHMPDFILHRDDQISKLAGMLHSALRGMVSSNILLYGATGTGKTMCAKYVLANLERKAIELNRKVVVAYLNCMNSKTTYSVYYNVGNVLESEIPLTGLSAEYALIKMKERIEEFNGIVWVVLDEVDKLIGSGEDAIYNLTRINSELSHSKVGVMGISNTSRFVQVLDPRCRSSLSQEEIVFPPYDTDQLLNILKQRASEAFKPKVVTDAVIKLCAAMAAKEHGDARKALNLLRVSGEIAERLGDREVTHGHVYGAVDNIESDKMKEIITTYPFHFKLVLKATSALHTTKPRFSTIEVYATYRKLCDTYNSTPLTQRRISEIITELSGMGVLSTKHIFKGREGRTKEVQLALPIDDVNRYLENM